MIPKKFRERRIDYSCRSTNFKNQNFNIKRENDEQSEFRTPKHFRDLKRSKRSSPNVSGAVSVNDGIWKHGQCIIEVYHGERITGSNHKSIWWECFLIRFSLECIKRVHRDDTRRHIVSPSTLRLLFLTRETQSFDWELQKCRKAVKDLGEPLHKHWVRLILPKKFLSRNLPENRSANPFFYSIWKLIEQK